MRKILALVFLAALALIGCAGTTGPAPTPGERSPAVAPTALPAATVSPVQDVQASPLPPSPTRPATSTRTPTPAPILDVEPSSLPPSTTPAPTSPPVAESPWPRFLRELTFGIPAGNSYAPRALAVHAGLGRLYVHTQTRDPDAGENDAITEIDTATGQVLRVSALSFRSYGEGALVVDAQRYRLYATNPSGPATTVLDARTLAPVTELEGVGFLALDVGAGRLYTAGLAGFEVLDASTFDRLLRAPLPSAQRPLALAVDPVAGRVYLAHRGDAGYALSTYDAATLQARETITLPGLPDQLLPDPSRERLYVTLDDGEHSLLWTLDSDGRFLGERRLNGWTENTALALDADGGRLFLGRETYGNYGIVVLDLQTGQESADIPLVDAPRALAWDGGSRRLLLSHAYADRIGVVDPQTGRVDSVFPTAIDLVDLALDPDRGHLYISDSVGRLHVLDSDSDEILAVLPAEGYLAVDSAHGRFYSGSAQAGRVRIFDSDRLQQTGEIHRGGLPVADAFHGGLYLVDNGVYLVSLETMTVTGVISDTLPQNPGFSPDPRAINAVVDPGSGRVFAIINNAVPGSNNGNYLYVYEPVTYRKVLTDTERSPAYLDVDPETGLAYVSRVHLAGRSSSLLADGREYTARLDGAFGALQVDPVLGRVYLTASGSHGNQMLVLDADDLDALACVPVPGVILDLDPRRHLLYLATGQGRVQVWAATGGQVPEVEPLLPVNLTAEDIDQFYPSPGGGPVFALDNTNHLVRSDEGQGGWMRIRGGLPDEPVLDVAFSADFAQDQTLFAALASGDQGFGIWKSEDGGRSWQISSQGLTDLVVTHLITSPAYLDDQTLFAVARRGGLLRSTDSGRSWTSLTERYRPADAYIQPPGEVAFSPTYDRDGTLYINQYGLQRSTDGGDSWDNVWLNPLWPLAFVPNFDTDPTLFGWASNGGLLRSTDAGDTWRAANVGLNLLGYGSTQVFVSPDYPSSQTLYFVWTEGSGGEPIQLYRSTDAAATWEGLVGGLAPAASVVGLTADGRDLVVKDNSGELAAWPLQDFVWQSGALPPLDRVPIERLVFSPGFAQDRTLWGLSRGVGILHSDDGGLTWSETGFPVRFGLGEPDELVAVSPDTLFIGTALGLYRFDGGGGWELVSGGLPQGTKTSSPDIGREGLLWVLVGGEDRRNGPRVFLSGDGGRTWTQPLPDLPDAVEESDVHFSPDFAGDKIAFVAVPWRRPQRSVGGSNWEEFGPSGMWALTGFYISPAFDRDGLLLLAFEDGSLWRSTDEGDSWTHLAVPWGGESISEVLFSTAYAQDGVLLALAGGGLYHSVDEGSTWSRVLDLDWSLPQLQFAPGYARSGEVYLTQNGVLYRSVDRARTWQTLRQVPWEASQTVWLELSPALARDRTLLAWLAVGRVYQSSDGGRTWRDVSKGLPSTGIRNVLFSPGYADDGLVYLIPQYGGLYKRAGDRPWQPVTERTPPATPKPPPTPAADSLPTPTSVPCAKEPVRFYGVWHRPEVRPRLGCLESAAVSVFLGEQIFERGRMLWDSSTGQIYVLLESGIWQAFGDTWTSDQPEIDPALVPPEGRIQPQRGFGKVWREKLGGPETDIGWAIGGERPVDGWRQAFQGGLLVWTDAVLPGVQETGTAYLLYDGGGWQAVPAPLP